MCPRLVSSATHLPRAFEYFAVTTGAGSIDMPRGGVGGRRSVKWVRVGSPDIDGGTISIMQ